MIKAAAQELLHDLQEYRLEVVLTPAPDPRHHGHMVRAAVNQNPQWYSDLFDREGYVRRKTVEMVLERLGRTGVFTGKGRYEELLRPLIEEYAEQMEEDCMEVPF
jgi:hypothetical protein